MRELKAREVLETLYEEIYAQYRGSDPELVRRHLVRDALGSRVFLLGQALGRDTQRLSGFPYHHPPSEHPQLSRGGHELQRFVAKFGYRINLQGPGQYAYHTDLAHYFPGRKRRGTGDVLPTKAEVARNRGWFEIELRAIQPAIIITLGKQSTAALLGHYANRRIGRLTDIAGIPIDCNVVGQDVQLIAVHHPSRAFQHPSSRDAYECAAAHICRILQD